MATYDEAMQALRNADAAGDTEAAQRLAQVADSLKPTGPVSTGSALGKGVVQGATFGFGDELSGAGRALLEGISPSDPSQSRLDAIKQGYQDTRNSVRQSNAEAQAAHPGAYLTGNVAGAALTAPLLPGGAIGSVGDAALNGGALGGLSGFGSAEGAASDQAKSTVRGAILGALAGPVAYGATKGLGALGENIGDYLAKKNVDHAGTRFFDQRTDEAAQWLSRARLTQAEAQQELGKLGSQTTTAQARPVIDKLQNATDSIARLEQQVRDRGLLQTPERSFAGKQALREVGGDLNQMGVSPDLIGRVSQRVPGVPDPLSSAASGALEGASLGTSHGGLRGLLNYMSNPANLYGAGGGALLGGAVGGIPGAVIGGAAGGALEGGLAAQMARSGTERLMREGAGQTVTNLGQAAGSRIAGQAGAAAEAAGAAAGINPYHQRILEQMANDRSVPAATPEAKLHVLNQTDPAFREKMKEEDATD